LVLFATWSAATSRDERHKIDSKNESPQFAYPGRVSIADQIKRFIFCYLKLFVCAPGTLFLTYNIGFSAALTHLKRHFKQIQGTWEQKWQAIKDLEQVPTDSTAALFRIPKPSNTSYFDGGNWEFRLKKPLELPHVLLLPLTSYIHHKGNGQPLELPGLKADVLDGQKESFVVHSKTYTEVCTNKKCWPFVRSD
jgi:hypothetical protein